MSLASLISINCNEMNQARLLVRHQEREATLFFEDGNIVHASLDSREGADAVYELLTWGEGEFKLEHGVPPPRHTVTTGWSALLLEGVQRIDERAVGEPAPSEDEERLDEVSMSKLFTTANEDSRGNTHAAELLPKHGVAETTEKSKKTPRSLGVRGETIHSPGVEARPASSSVDATEEGLIRKLREIDGVAGVVIVAKDGIVLAGDMEDKAEKEGAVAVFVGNAASQIGEVLALGSFESGLVEMGSPATRMLVLEQLDYYTGFLLEERASAARIAARARNM